MEKVRKIATLLIVFIICIDTVGQAKDKYLVFIFNHISHNDTHLNASNYYTWIIPYDSINIYIDETKLTPLFVSKSQLEVLSDPDNLWGMCPIFNSEKQEPLVKFLFDNARLIQKITKKCYCPVSNERWNIYLIPIIASCKVNKLLHFQEEIITMEEMPDFWSDFWITTDEDRLRRIRGHHFDFIRFNFVIGLHPRKDL